MQSQYHSNHYQSSQPFNVQLHQRGCRLKSDGDNKHSIFWIAWLNVCLPWVRVCVCVCGCICDCFWVYPVCVVWMSDVSFIHETINSTTLQVPAVVNPSICYSFEFRAIPHGIHHTLSHTLAPVGSAHCKRCVNVLKSLSPVFFFLSKWFDYIQTRCSWVQISHWFHINNFSADTPFMAQWTLASHPFRKYSTFIAQAHTHTQTITLTAVTFTWPNVNFIVYQTSDSVETIACVHHFMRQPFKWIAVFLFQFLILLSWHLQQIYNIPLWPSTAIKQQQQHTKNGENRENRWMKQKPVDANIYEMTKTIHRITLECEDKQNVYLVPYPVLCLFF